MKQNFVSDDLRFDTNSVISESIEPFRINCSSCLATKRNDFENPYFTSFAELPSETARIKLTDRNSSTFIEDSPSLPRINDSLTKSTTVRFLSVTDEPVPLISNSSYKATRRNKTSQIQAEGSRSPVLIIDSVSTPMAVGDDHNFIDMIENTELLKDSVSRKSSAINAAAGDELTFGLSHSSTKREDVVQDTGSQGKPFAIENRLKNLHLNPSSLRIFRKAINGWRLKKMLDYVMNDKENAIHKGISIQESIRNKSIWTWFRNGYIDPRNPYLTIWRFFFQIELIFFSFVFSSRLVFSAEIFQNEAMDFIIIMIDVCFLIEIILTFFIAIKRPDGSLIWNKKLIAKQYFKSTFLINVLAIFPFEYFDRRAAILKFLRIIHLNSIFNHIEKLMKLIVPLFVRHLNAIAIAKFAGSVISYIISPNEIINHQRITIVLAILFHFSACIWIALGYPLEPSETTWFSTVKGFDYTTHPTRLNEDDYNIYVAGLFHVIQTYTTVGYGTNTGYTIREYLFCLVLQCFGILIFVVFFQKSKSTTSQFNHTEIRANKEIEELELWLIKLKRDVIKRTGTVKSELFRSIQITVMRAFLHARRQNLIMNNKQFQHLDHQSKNLVLDLTFQKLEKRFHIFFRNVSKAFAHRILTHVYPKFFMCGETIIETGKPSKGIFFILEGSVVLAKTKIEEAFLRLEKNSYFGESSLLERKRVPFSYIAETNVDCLFLGAEVVEGLISQFPKDVSHLKAFAYHRIKYFVNGYNQRFIKAQKREEVNKEGNVSASYRPLETDYSPIYRVSEKEQDLSFAHAHRNQNDIPDKITLDIKRQALTVTTESNHLLITEQNKEEIEEGINDQQKDLIRPMNPLGVLKTDSDLANESSEKEDDISEASSCEGDESVSEDENELERSGIFPVDNVELNDGISISDEKEILDYLQERVLFLKNKLANIERSLRHETQYLCKRLKNKSKKFQE